MVSVHSRIRVGLKALLDILYPPHCVVCERDGAWLCDSCLATVQSMPAPNCPHCGRPMPAPILCAPCRAHVSNLVNLRSVGYYATPLREAIHALKYSGVRALAEPLSALLADCLKVWSPPIEVIVPVPLHRSRVRYRGYNQASLLAQALGQRVCLPVCGDCLERQRATRSQVGLTAPERHSNVAGAFACTTNSLHGTRVLLVDDVFTTGATLEASAQALLAAGALGVWALTLARAADPA